MRSEDEMFDLILSVARADERIRAVILNGSRANPNAPRDLFQDFDIVYIVTDLESFRADPAWIDVFGERVILQLPDEMQDPPPEDGLSYAYLIQFRDGSRIDLSLFPRDRLAEMHRDSLSVLLLDKDGIVAPFPPPSEADYLPQPPAAGAFADCCNEFWWVSTYVAKGLWRGETLYAHAMLDEVVRVQLMKMLVWRIGVETGFRANPGKAGRFFRRYLSPEDWAALLATYPDAEENRTWDALEGMAVLFRNAARRVAGHFGFDYPEEDDARVSAHLRRVRSLPRDAQDFD